MSQNVIGLDIEILQGHCRNSPIRFQIIALTTHTDDIHISWLNQVSFTRNIKDILYQCKLHE